MKAVVRDLYGSAYVVRVEDVPTRYPAATRCWCGVHAAVVGVVDSVAREGVLR
jgi:NADPH:quinone reductase-like Zn-dependent oxidoreductase